MSTNNYREEFENVVTRATAEIRVLPYTESMHELQQGYARHEEKPMHYGFSDSRTHKIQRSDDELKMLLDEVNTTFKKRNYGVQFNFENFKERYLIGYWGWRGKEFFDVVTSVSSIEQQLYSAATLEGMIYANSVGNRGKLTADEIVELRSIVTSQFTNAIEVSAASIEFILWLAVASVAALYIYNKYVSGGVGMGWGNGDMTLSDYARAYGFDITYEGFGGDGGGGGGRPWYKMN